MHFTFKREAIATAIILIALPLIGLVITLLLPSLNHPGIAHIYGVGELALVMELVPGLRWRIASRPLTWPL